MHVSSYLHSVSAGIGKFGCVKRRYPFQVFYDALGVCPTSNIFHVLGCQHFVNAVQILLVRQKFSDPLEFFFHALTSLHSTPLKNHVPAPVSLPDQIPRLTRLTRPVRLCLLVRYPPVVLNLPGCFCP